MEITLRRYGNSTVAVLPPALLKELHLAVGQSMSVDTTADGKIIMSKKRKYTLSELVAQCDTSAPSPADIELWDNAKPVGEESW
jgi:antitoxin ChpS